MSGLHELGSGLVRLKQLHVGAKDAVEKDRFHSCIHDRVRVGISTSVVEEILVPRKIFIEEGRKLLTVLCQELREKKLHFLLG